MKTILAALLATSLVTPAYADGGHGRSHEYWDDDHRGGWSYEGHRDGWGWDGSWFLPALIGSAIFLDIARSNTYSQPEPVYVQPEPIYSAPVSPPSVAAAPPPPQVWYFCPEANAYYPYVKSCANGWQTVPATPPQ